MDENIKLKTETKVGMQPQTFNMIKAGNFELNIYPNGNIGDPLPTMIIDPLFIAHPTFKTGTQEMEDYSVTINGTLIKREFFFGKPTKNTNILTYQEIIEFINNYNEEKYDYMTVREFDENNECALETIYYDPQITLVEMGHNIKDSDDNKSMTFTFTFSKYESKHAR